MSAAIDGIEKLCYTAPIRKLGGNTLMNMPDARFWAALDRLISDSKIVIDRPKDSPHPRYPDMIYPADYGYLENTRSMDGSGIDLYRGAEGAGRLDAIMVTIDLKKRDSEIKLLLGLSAEEKEKIFAFHNDSENQAGMMVERDCAREAGAE